MTHCRFLVLAAGLALLAVPARADLFGRDPVDGAAANDAATNDAAGATGGTPAESGFTAAALVEALPRSWHGTFAWDDGVAYFVEMEIVKLTVRPDGNVAFNAETRWLPDELRARMSGRIDPATLAVRVWEIADDAGAGDFESDGSYVGIFAADLWDLRARWETTGTGETGDLVLITTAVPYIAE